MTGGSGLGGGSLRGAIHGIDQNEVADYQHAMVEKADDRQQGVQAARGLSALAVMYYHSNLALGYFETTKLWTIGYLAEYGAFGVDVFFAISGYIVCLVADRPGFSIRSFLIKRLFRIFPLTAVVTIIVAVVAPMTDWSLFNRFDTSDFIASLLQFPYSHPLNPVAWTLQYEVCFYLISAAIFSIAGARSLLAYCLLAAAVAYVHPIENIWIEHFFGIRYASFGAGVAAYLLLPYLADKTMKNLPGIAMIGGFAMLHIGPLLHIPYSTSISAGAMVIAATSWKPKSRWLSSLGDISYGVYLIHFPLFIVLNGEAWWHHLPTNYGEAYRWSAFTLSILIATISWHLIEKPINNAVRAKLSRRVYPESSPVTSPA